MKTLEEIRERLAEITNEKRSLLETAADDNRADLNEEEEKRFNELDTEYAGLVKQEKRLAEIEEQERQRREVESVNRRYIPAHDSKPAQFSKAEERDIEGYSFGKALSELIQGRSLTGIEKEMNEEGVKQYREQGLTREGNLIIPQVVLNRAGHESRDERDKRERRDLLAGTATDGAELVQTSVGSLIERLRNRLVIGQLGATQLNGLVGNIDFPVFTANDTAAEKTEVDTAPESFPQFSTKTISPNRLPVFTNYSRQLLIQAQNESVEAMIRDDLAFQIAQQIDTAAINGSGSAPVPEGILQTSGIGDVAGGTNGAAPDWADVVSLETEVAVDNADMGSLAYLTNAKVRGKLKQTSKAGTEAIMVWGDNASPLNGYRAAVTNIVPSTLDKGTSTGVCSAIIFGNFADVLIGQWGGVEFLVNPYTLDTTGLIRLNAWTFYDVLIRRAESFAAMQDALTT